LPWALSSGRDLSEDAGAYQNDPKWRYVKMIENGRHSNNEEFTETVEHWKPRKTFEPEK
jgi:hypothetical protein